MRLFRSPVGSAARPAPGRRFRPGVTALEGRDVPAPVGLNQVPAYSSNPAAAVKIYLDFNGHFEPEWGGAFVGPVRFGEHDNVRTPAFDRDGDPTTFSDAEQRAIQEVCARVAEDFAPFNVDVTTVDPGDFSNGRAVRVALGGSDTDWYTQPGEKGAGGVAKRNSFTNRQENVVYVFAADYSDLGDLADAASHEVGHSFGLAHQSEYDAAGNKIEEYNSNGGSTALAPLMGYHYDGSRTVWWQGPNADKNWQDDMAVLARSENGFGYRRDDHPDNLTQATPLRLTPVDPNPWPPDSPFRDLKLQQVWTGGGIIGTTADRDMFSFAATGPITVEVRGIVAGANLDADFELRDDRGNVLPVVGVRNDLNVSFRYAPPADGSTGEYALRSYRLVVKSQGGYGDVGRYTVTVGETGGPRVVAGVPGRNTFRVTFDRPIDAATFGRDDVTVTDARGVPTPVLRVAAVAGSDGRSFDVTFVPTPTGGYAIAVGPRVADTLGRGMNHDRDATNAEAGPDEYRFRDFVGPRVTAATPTAGRIRVEFDEAVDPTTFTPVDVRLTSPAGAVVPVAGLVAVAGGDNRAFDLIVPAIPAGGYDLAVGPDVRDAAGNLMNQDGDATNGESVGDVYRASVRDATGPRVTGVGGGSPQLGLRLTFDEAIDEATFTPADLTVTNALTGARVVVTAVRVVPGTAGRGFEVRFDAPVGTYTLTVGPNVNDVYGNRMAATYQQTFRHDHLTRPDPFPVPLDPRLSLPLEPLGPLGPRAIGLIDPVLNPRGGRSVFGL